MSTYRLEKLFTPRSVAVVGASPRERSLGRVVLRNLRAGGFSGSLTLVNPRHREIEGVTAVARIDAVDPVPDVAVITAPPEQVPQIVAAAAGKGVAAAVILTAGLGHGAGSLAEAAERAAREKGLRIVGPNCLGVIAPAGISTRALRRECRDGAILRSSPSPGRSSPAWPNGRRNAPSASRRWCRSATSSTSISAISWISLLSTDRRARCCSVSN